MKTTKLQRVQNSIENLITKDCLSNKDLIKLIKLYEKQSKIEGSFVTEMDKIERKVFK